MKTKAELQQINKDHANSNEKFREEQRDLTIRRVERLVVEAARYGATSIWLKPEDLDYVDAKNSRFILNKMVVQELFPDCKVETEVERDGPSHLLGLVPSYGIGALYLSWEDSYDEG